MSGYRDEVQVAALWIISHKLNHNDDWFKFACPYLNERLRKTLHDETPAKRFKACVACNAYQEITRIDACALRSCERFILMIGCSSLLADGVTGFCLGKFLATIFFGVLLASFGKDLRILAVNNACLRCPRLKGCARSPKKTLSKSDQGLRPQINSPIATLTDRYAVAERFLNASSI